MVERPHRNIRFTTTEDGAAIAFWTIGEGEPIVIIQNFNLSHADLEWEVPSIASFYTEMAKRYRVIRLDPRGIGLSGDRPGGKQNPYSTNQLCLDILAVADAIGLDSFTLMETSIACPVAIEFAATSPNLVSALVLCQGLATVASSHLLEPLRVQRALFRLEEDMGESYLNVWEPLVNEDDRVAVTRMVQDSLGRIGETAGQEEWDSQSPLGWIEAPTLVMSAGVPDGVVKDARNLAAGIARSELCVLEGNFAPYWTQRTATLRAIHNFLQSEDPSTAPVEFGFRTVVFTDIVPPHTCAVSVTRPDGPRYGSSRPRSSRLPPRTVAVLSRISVTVRSFRLVPTPLPSLSPSMYRTNAATVSSICASEWQPGSPSTKKGTSTAPWSLTRAASAISGPQKKSSFLTVSVNWPRAKVSPLKPGAK